MLSTKFLIITILTTVVTIYNYLCWPIVILLTILKIVGVEPIINYQWFWIYFPVLISFVITIPTYIIFKKYTSLEIKRINRRK